MTRVNNKNISNKNHHKFTHSWSTLFPYTYKNLLMNQVTLTHNNNK